MKSNKTVKLLLSLFLALSLWIYVVTVVTPEDDITIGDIPIVYSGEQEMRTERGLLISNQTTSYVSVKFHGSRADLKRLERYRSDLSAIIDTSAFNAEREYSSGYEIVLPAALQDQTVQIVDRTPKTVRFTVEKLVSKTVPVKGVFDGTVATGFTVGDLKFDLESVTVSGPGSDVERVQYAQAILDGVNVAETFSEPVALTLVDGAGEAIRATDLTLSEADVLATLTVLAEKEVPLKLTILPGGGATEENTAFELSQQTAVLRGEKSALDAITEVEIGTLALGEVRQDEKLSFDVTAPEGTQFVPELEKVTVTVAFEGLETREAVVSEFLAENVTENADETLKARIVTQSLEIELRGPAEALEAIKDEDLVAVADLTDYTKAGAFTVPVTIRTPDETVGAVGVYSVEMELYLEG